MQIKGLVKIFCKNKSKQVEFVLKYLEIFIDSFKCLNIPQQKLVAIKKSSLWSQM